MSTGASNALALSTLHHVLQALSEVSREVEAELLILHLAWSHILQEVRLEDASGAIKLDEEQLQVQVFPSCDNRQSQQQDRDFLPLLYCMQLSMCSRRLRHKTADG